MRGGLAVLCPVQRPNVQTLSAREMQHYVAAGTGRPLCFVVECENPCIFGAREVLALAVVAGVPDTRGRALRRLPGGVNLVDA